MAMEKRVERWTQIVVAWAFVVGCGSSGLDVNPNRGGGHKSFDAIELALVDTGETLAEWSLDGGWRVSSGEPLEALPSPVWSGDTVEPLRAGGPPASLEVRMLSQLSFGIAPLDGGASADVNPCGEFSARYFPIDDETSAIAWPNVPDPAQSGGGPALFAERTDGELVQVFHCNRLDIYPEQAGTAHLEIVLWHVNHADQASDALPVEILGSVP